MSDPFGGIAQKLNRAKENILNLDREIEGFFQSGEYPILPEDDNELLLKAIEYHRKRTIPLRFSVIAGEAIHHLRSCFDHVAWLFSSEWYRNSKEGRFIEFPILDTPPRKENRFTSYGRKVKGISDPGALTLIELLQPYNTGDPINSLLYIIHRFDITDKHQEMLMVGSSAAAQWPIDVIHRYLSYQRGIEGATPVDLREEYKRHGKMTPQVSFKDFGGRGLEPVVQGLVILLNFTVQTMRQFDALYNFNKTNPWSFWGM
jgi:hypothetical protein